MAMMITRESDYAIRILRALKNGEQLTIEQICQKELVPRQFAYKILKKLDRAGMVSIRRGAGGGCSLGRSLETLTLLDVIQAIDREFFLNPCIGKGYRCEYINGSFGQESTPDNRIAEDSYDMCGSGSNRRSCSVHWELSRIQRVLEQELGKKTLDKLFG